MKGHKLDYFFSLSSQEQVFAYQSMLMEREFKVRQQTKFLQAMTTTIAGIFGAKVVRR